MERRIPETIKFVYKKSDDYKSIYANGAQGGITVRGDFKFDLFHEYLLSPEEEIYKLTDTGDLGDKIEEEQDQKVMVRELKVGLTMSIQQAKSLADWLIRRITETEEFLEKHKEGDIPDANE